MVTCGTNALSLQEGSRVCFFRFPLEFGVPLARFLHIEPRRLNKSTAVAEIPEGTVRALAAIFKCVQGMVLVLLCRLQLVDRVLLRSEHNVAISRLLHHNVPRVLERFVHLGQTIQCHHSLIQVVHLVVRFRILLVRGAQATFPAVENPLQCPQIFFCNIDDFSLGLSLPLSFSFLFFFHFLFFFLRFLFLLSFLFFPFPRSIVLVFVLVRVVLSGVVVTAVAFVPPVRTFVLVTAEACPSGVPTVPPRVVPF